MDRPRSWLKSPWLASLLTLVVSVTAVFVVEKWVRAPDGISARRWAGGGVANETPAFIALVKPTPRNPDGPIHVTGTDWTSPHVDVYSVPAIAPPAPASPTLASLADSGQAHAIDFLAQGSHSWTDLQQTLVATTSALPEGKDPFRFDRVLVATVTRGATWDPGERMIWTRVFVQPINFQFAGYTVAGTENETVKVASVEDTSTRKFSADIGLTIPGLKAPEAKISPSSERSEKTSADISAQYEKLGVDIMPGFLRIIRESETGGDVLGNTKISLSVLTDPKTIRKTYPSEVVNADPEDTAVLLVTNTHLFDGPAELKNGATITALPQTPLLHCPLMARVWMLYERRQIDAGREYYDESRQSVTLWRDADVQKDVEVAPADDVSPAVWSIQILAESNPSPEAPKTFLKAHVGRGTPREVDFTDYNQASILAHWLRTHFGTSVSNLTFDYDGNGSVLPVKRTRNECDRDANSANTKVTYQRYSH